MVTNLDDTKANRQQIEQDATQSLIDEILKLDAAKAIDPSIVERSRETAKNLVDENFADKGKMVHIIYAIMALMHVMFRGSL